MSAVEINNNAVKELKKIINSENIYEGSITEKELIKWKNKKFDLVFTKTVLIHINPKLLSEVYNLIYNLSSKYILLCEYYSPNPVNITYRKNRNKLFKRDFAGEFLSLYKNVTLIDYGFVYHKDNNFPQDDVNWFLLKKLKS